MFAAPELITEINADLAPFRSQIVQRESVLCALALSRQKRIAAVNQRLQRAHVDGLGEVVASIDPDIWHRLGAIYGYQTLKDPDFLKSLLRDNEDCRVKSVSRQVSLRISVDYKGEMSEVRDQKSAKAGLPDSPSSLTSDLRPLTSVFNTDPTTPASRADVCTSPC